MFYFSFLRMARALKIHLHPISIASKFVKNSFESVKFILEKVKTFLFVVNKSLSYLLFRVYSADELMIEAVVTTAATRMERSESGPRFLIFRLRENSWGKEQASTRRELSENSLILLLL